MKDPGRMYSRSHRLRPVKVVARPVVTLPPEHVARRIEFDREEVYVILLRTDIAGHVDIARLIRSHGIHIGIYRATPFIFARLVAPDPDLLSAAFPRSNASFTPDQHHPCHD